MNAPANDKLAITVKTFKPWRQNTLRGFVDLAVPALHMTIVGCVVHVSHGKRWIGLPSKPVLDANGVAARDERGKIRYVPVIQFDAKTRERFSERAVEALLARYPTRSTPKRHDMSLKGAPSSATFQPFETKGVFGMSGNDIKRRRQAHAV
jgi:hypothetical protein